MQSIRLFTTAIADWRTSCVPDVAVLFEEYASAYARGERPRAHEYLVRAGAAADDLAELIDRFLARTPAPAADGATAALIAAWADGEPPLVPLRASTGVRVDEVVDEIVVSAGVEMSKRARVKRYYPRLEQGLLETKGVSTTVWEVLERLLGAEARDAVGWPGKAVAGPQPAFYRALPSLDLSSSSAPETALEPPDEVDRLFTNDR
jgi:hypothetical protein